MQLFAQIPIHISHSHPISTSFLIPCFPSCPLPLAGMYRNQQCIRPSRLEVISRVGCVQVYIVCVVYSKTSEQRTLWGQAICPL